MWRGSRFLFFLGSTARWRCPSLWVFFSIVILSFYGGGFTLIAMGGQEPRALFCHSLCIVQLFVCKRVQVVVDLMWSSDLESPRMAKRVHFLPDSLLFVYFWMGDCIVRRALFGLDREEKGEHGWKYMKFVLLDYWCWVLSCSWNFPMTKKFSGGRLSTLLQNWTWPKTTLFQIVQKVHIRENTNLEDCLECSFTFHPQHRLANTWACCCCFYCCCWCGRREGAMGTRWDESGPCPDCFPGKNILPNLLVIDTMGWSGHLCWTAHASFFAISLLGSIDRVLYDQKSIFEKGTAVIKSRWKSDTKRWLCWHCRFFRPNHGWSEQGGSQKRVRVQAHLIFQFLGCRFFSLSFFLFPQCIWVSLLPFVGTHLHLEVLRSVMLKCGERCARVLLTNTSRNPSIHAFEHLVPVLIRLNTRWGWWVCDKSMKERRKIRRPCSGTYGLEAIATEESNKNRALFFLFWQVPVRVSTLAEEKQPAKYRDIDLQL